MDRDKDNLIRHHALHTPSAIRARLASGPDHSYLRDFTFGAIDGLVTTFAMVAAVAGADLSPTIVIIVGLANVLADGFSMAVSNFLGVRADQKLLQQARRSEEAHIRLYPEGEREEIRQILMRKGFAGEDLNRAVDVITSDLQRWVDTMLTEELGLALHRASAWRAALATFVAFVFIGLVPLVPFLMPLQALLGLSPFAVSAAGTALAFFLVGAFRARFTEEKWPVSGLETLAVGGTAAFLAWLVGALLKDILPSG